MASVGKNIGKLCPKSSVLFICDMQEKFRNNIKYFPQIVCITNRLLQSFKILSSPIICTEQYPKGLGPTVPELALKDNGLTAFDKTQFSMCLPPINKILTDNEVKNIVLCGIEAHVCIQNTTLDLLENGFKVHVVVDAVSSRSMTDRMYALERMRDSGAYLTTSESVILGLAGGSHHPNFRELQKIIFESAPDTGLLNPSQ